MWRRIKLIPFNHVFTNDEQDPELTNKLKSEYAGILTWMVQGLCSYNATGLQEPKKVIDATMAYREEMNSVKRFIAEALELDNDSRELQKSKLVQDFPISQPALIHASKSVDIGLVWAYKSIGKALIIMDFGKRGLCPKF